MSGALKWTVAGAVLVGLALVFALRPGPTVAPQAEATSTPFADGARLTLTTPNEIFTFDKGTSGWRITSPVASPGDGAAIDAVVARFSGLTTDRVASPDRTKAAEFGLVTPTVTVRLTSVGGGREKAWLVGNEGPDGTAFAVEGDPRIFFGPPRLMAGIDHPLETLRDRSLVTFAIPKVQKVFVDRQGKSWLVEREGGTWQRRQPTAGPADATLVESLLHKLQTAKALDYLDDRKPADAAGLATFGLDKPAALVTLVLDDASQTLLVGVAGEGGERRVYGRVAAGGPVMLVDGTLLEDLQKEP